MIGESVGVSAVLPAGERAHREARVAPPPPGGRAARSRALRTLPLSNDAKGGACDSVCVEMSAEHVGIASV